MKQEWSSDKKIPTSTTKKKYDIPTFEGPIEECLYYRKEYKIGVEKIGRDEAIECDIPIYRCDPHLPKWEVKYDDFLSKGWKPPIKKNANIPISKVP